MQHEQAAPQLILGTAGHIDHGKTALVRALTGVDCDRLPEEQARGITIELGFAPLDLDGGLRLGVVDVPGHEGLVRTMVAGATGIDLLLLVVAADEGVMPQTREHIAICELLGIERGVVALTKLDVVGEELAELAQAEVEELLGTTALAGAPIIPVSAHEGTGLDTLREALREAAAATPPRTPRTGPPRLPVDRSFAAKGFGCVATGTLQGAPVRAGDEFELLPAGHRGRIRGLQSHGADAKTVAPGARCAVNLHGVELEDVTRGCVLTAPGAFEATACADVRLLWLDVAPACEGPSPVLLLAGTAERSARVAAIGPDDELLPGRVGFARLHIEGDPMPLLPGDRFIVRGFARTEMGGSTLGGGVVLDVAPPHRRRSDPELVKDLEALTRRDPVTDVRVRVARAGFAGAPRDTLQRETGFARGTLEAALRDLDRDGLAASTASGTWLALQSLSALEERLLEALAAYHTAEPLRPGMPTGALRGSLPENVRRDVADLAQRRLVDTGRCTLEGDVARLPEHRPTLGPDLEAAASRIEEESKAAGLDPPALRDWETRLELPGPKLRDLLAHLERKGALVRAPGDLWFDADAVADLRAKVRAHFEQHDALDTQTYKDLIGTTRRAAMPLMELLDTEHLTVRRGEVRVLRRRE